jgi:hypothetical protein
VKAFVVLYEPPNNHYMKCCRKSRTNTAFSGPTASDERTLDWVALGVGLPVEALTSTVAGLHRDDPLDRLVVRIVANAVAAFGRS